MNFTALLAGLKTVETALALASALTGSDEGIASDIASWSMRALQVLQTGAQIGQNMTPKIKASYAELEAQVKAGGVTRELIADLDLLIVDQGREIDAKLAALKAKKAAG